tara:strand:- start:30 stop:632 length:603 start_codon:yes stop_codon:yes gene_type:complete
MAISLNGSTNVITGIAVGGLPDGIVDTDMLAANAVSSAKLASGAGGKILQVKQTVKTNTASRIATSFADLVTVTITPASAASKFLVSYKCTMSTANGGYSGAVRLTRDSTAIYVGDASGNRRQCSSAMQADVDGYGHIKTRDMNGEFLDSPNTISAITYKLQYASDYSNAFVYIGKSQEDSNAIYRPRVPTSITVMEVAA